MFCQILPNTALVYPRIKPQILPDLYTNEINYYHFNFFKAQRKIERQKLSLLPIQVDQKSIDKEIRATISISIIVLVFCITWIPLQILYLLSIFCKDCIQVCVVNFAISLLHLNSAINPLIYAYRMEDIRNEIYSLFFTLSSLMNSSSVA